MNAAEVETFKSRKAEIRAEAHANRNAQENKDDLSRAICARFMGLPEYAAATRTTTATAIESLAVARSPVPPAVLLGADPLQAGQPYTRSPGRVLSLAAAPTNPPQEG